VISGYQYFAEMTERLSRLSLQWKTGQLITKKTNQEVQFKSAMTKLHNASLNKVEEVENYSMTIYKSMSLHSNLYYGESKKKVAAI
jgi:hypothetical protein